MNPSARSLFCREPFLDLERTETPGPRRGQGRPLPVADPSSIWRGLKRGKIAVQTTQNFNMVADPSSIWRGLKLIPLLAHLKWYICREPFLDFERTETPMSCAAGAVSVRVSSLTLPRFGED